MMKTIKISLLCCFSLVICAFLLIACDSSQANRETDTTAISDIRTDPSSDTTTSTTEESTPTDTAFESITETNSETTLPDHDDATEDATVDFDTLTQVWISDTGKKYHSKSTCSNMESPTQISLAEAKKQGYDACKKCH